MVAGSGGLASSFMNQGVQEAYLLGELLSRVKYL